MLSPGRLDVYRIALDRESPRQARVRIRLQGHANIATLAQLGNPRPRAAINERSWISNIVLRLLNGSITKLIGFRCISDQDAISLVGRALFTRFLADRLLLPESMSGRGSAATLFDSRETARETSRWLDATFNGDLRLYLKRYRLIA